MSSPQRVVLTFAPDFEASRVRLFEVDEALLAQLDTPGAVAIKGSASDEAHLVTPTATFTVRLAESTNTMLLLPPEPGGPRTVHARIHDTYELRPSAPRWFQLRRLLSQRLYRGPSEESAVRGAIYGRAALASLVQCSEAELTEGLNRVSALLLDDHWRLLDAAYERRVVELLLSYALEHNWPLDALPLEDALRVSSSDHDGRVVRHVLVQLGTLLPGALALRLDPVRLSRFHALALLAARPSWPLHDFLSAWRQALPANGYCGEPDVSQLFGSCIVDHHKGALASSIRMFVLDPPPATADELFPLLFAERAVWPEAQIVPYVAAVATPSANVDQLLLRHTFVNRVDAATATVSKR